MYEKLNTNQNENPANNEWEKLTELSDEQSVSEKEDFLPLYTEVAGGYKISSMPFEEKDDAYEEIKNNWQGAENVTTYFDKGKWYIISK